MKKIQITGGEISCVDADGNEVPFLANRFEIHLGRNNRLTRIEVDGKTIPCTAFSLHYAVGHIPVLKIETVALEIKP